MRAAREGQGPTLIEAFTYRMGAHTTTDDPTRYRLASEVEAWRLRDPIDRVRAYLTRTGEADSSFFEQVEAEADAEAARLRAAAWRCPIRRRWRCSTTCTRAQTAILDAERGITRRTWMDSRTRHRGAAEEGR